MLRAQSPKPASERFSPLPAPTLPQPGGAAGDRARQRQARRCPAPRQVLRPPRASDEATEAGALLSATTPRTRSYPGRSFARLTYPAKGQFLRLLSPPATHPSRGLAAGQAQALLSAPEGPVASAAPEPGTRPSGEGRSRLGTTAPPPQRPTQQWGRGQPPLLSTGRQAQSQR